MDYDYYVQFNELYEKDKTIIDNIRPFIESYVGCNKDEKKKSTKMSAPPTLDEVFFDKPGFGPTMPAPIAVTGTQLKSEYGTLTPTAEGLLCEGKNINFTIPKNQSEKLSSMTPIELAHNILSNYYTPNNDDDFSNVVLMMGEIVKSKILATLNTLN